MSDVLSQVLMVMALVAWVPVFLAGVWWKSRQLRKAVMRNKGSPVLQDIVIQPAGNAMEVLLSNSVLKKIRNGHAVEGEVVGRKNRMCLRLKRI